MSLSESGGAGKSSKTFRVQWQPHSFATANPNLDFAKSIMAVSSAEYLSHAPVGNMWEKQSIQQSCLYTLSNLLGAILCKRTTTFLLS
eukprot:4906578-Amphidinium_carterae.1